ncbi:hypothetical protein LINGRAPRIM_LOCUS459 [Linum grandiflorum]
MTPPHATLSLRFTLISTAVLAASALLLKTSLPHFSPVVYRILVLWTSFSSTWLTPPYLYLFLNFIIVTIAASSRLQRYPLSTSSDSDRFGFCEVKEWRRPPADSGFQDKFVVSTSSAWNDDPRKMRIASTENDFMEPKCLVSARFGDRKPVKIRLQGGRTTTSVRKQNRGDTLDDTWKKITEGRPILLKKHHKKQDTWPNTKHGSHVNDAMLESSCLQSTTPPAATMKKSATFKDMTAKLHLAGDHQVIASKPIDDGPMMMMKKSATFKDRTDFQVRRPSNGGGGKLRKEASLSQDELNRRVEEFINKFNKEMRMQRQESINRYKDIIS